MSVYTEYRFWSPMLGTDAARLSMGDGKGGEFFMVIPCEGGKAYRASRAAALEAISTAISLGLDPGEVRLQ